jgi:hypothetical protein
VECFLEGSIYAVKTGDDPEINGLVLNSRHLRRNVKKVRPNKILDIVGNGTESHNANATLLFVIYDTD